MQTSPTHIFWGVTVFGTKSFFYKDNNNIQIIGSAHLLKMKGFRKCFDFPSLSVANWFPGHMARGTVHKVTCEPAI